MLWAIPVESLDMDHKRALDRRLLFGHSESLDERLCFSVFFVNLGSPQNLQSALVRIVHQE